MWLGGSYALLTALNTDECQARLTPYLEQALLYGYATRQRQRYHGRLLVGQVTESGFWAKHEEGRWAGFAPRLAGRFHPQPHGTHVHLHLRTTIWQGLAPVLSVAAILWAMQRIAARVPATPSSASNYAIAAVVLVVGLLYAAGWVRLTVAHHRSLAAFVRDVLNAA